MQAGKRELEGHWVGLKGTDQDMTHTFSFPLARDGHMNAPNHRELNNVYVYELTHGCQASITSGYHSWFLLSSSAFYHAICKSWAGCQLSMLCSSCSQPMGKLSVLLVPPRAWGCVYSTHLFHTPMPFAHFDNRCVQYFTSSWFWGTWHSQEPPTMLKNQSNASGPTLTMGTGEHGWAGWRGRSDSSASDLGVPRLVDSELCAWEVKARPWTPLLWVLLWLWAEPASLPG